ncbi:hypothetical protein, partial [Haematobacter missouriensis]|uniref:hypothetical protein n=1 Tax=Haematobacter missouriensis TaxID=366616 RepID=UPI001E2AB5F1
MLTDAEKGSRIAAIVKGYVLTSRPARFRGSSDVEVDIPVSQRWIASPDFVSPLRLADPLRL